MLKSFLAGLLNIDDENEGYETLVSLMRAAQAMCQWILLPL